MSIDELQRLAEQGDTGAMIELANQIYDGEDYLKIEEATSWELRAAEAGSVAGVMRSITGCNLLACINLLPDITDWQEALRYARLTIHWSNVALKEIQLDEEDSQLVNNTRTESRYYCGLCNYFLQDYKAAMLALQDIAEPRAIVLYGASAYGSEMPNRLETAYRFLSQIERDNGYIMAEKEHYEDAILSIAACELSVYYRVGLPNVAPLNMEHAVSLLNRVLAGLKDDTAREMIQQELKKYQKKLFGGYKYIG